MQNLLLVFIGGGLGAVCRYISTTHIGALFGTYFPFGTLFVNTLGSLLMGFIMGSLVFLMEKTGLRLAEPPAPDRRFPRRLHDVLFVQPRDRHPARGRQLLLRGHERRGQSRPLFPRGVLGPQPCQDPRGLLSH